MSDLRQVCAELRGWTCVSLAYGGNWTPPGGYDFAHYDSASLPDPLSWDSVGELRDAAIALGDGKYVDALFEILQDADSEIYDPDFPWRGVVAVGEATKEQILAAAISVLRPMEVDEAVRLVDEWSER